VVALSHEMLGLAENYRKRSQSDNGLLISPDTPFDFLEMYGTK
jgi:hypothetical protein